MIIQAELKCKQTGCEADPCAVDKVIELPSPRFQQFSRALLTDYDFIAPIFRPAPPPARRCRTDAACPAAPSVPKPLLLTDISKRL